MPLQNSSEVGEEIGWSPDANLPLCCHFLAYFGHIVHISGYEHMETFHVSLGRARCGRISFPPALLWPFPPA